MTSKELFEKMNPERHSYIAQFNSCGLDFNTSDIFSRLIKEAAKCECYNSDVFYDLKNIEESFKNFDPEKEFEPIWLGFRKMGVDCTNFVLCRVNDAGMYGKIADTYFVLYSLTVERKGEGFYTVYLTKYPTKEETWTDKVTSSGN